MTRVQRAERAAPPVDFLHRRAAEGLADSLDAIPRAFPVVVDLSPRTGIFADVLAAHDAAARIGSVTVPVASAERVVPGEGPLGLEDGSVDLIASVLGLHWANDLPGALAQIRRALKPDGLFLGAMFGAGTLAELRDVLTRAELDETGGAAPRVSPFADAYDAAGLMQRAGFALPVVDGDTVAVRYPDMMALVRDLRAMGEGGPPEGPKPRLSRRTVARAAGLYDQRHSVTGDDARPRVQATFETLFLTGWAPSPDQPKPLKPGSVATGFRVAPRKV
ncbi:methyltransferase domain-containing protein [Brevundimonas sp.]|uniref:methyltransferase domain-containing protein n=1 Tax=Brevundimonas sp. TaxID=1871086 RepID=UPI0025BA603D|nr:methyltransferase domain-containing protein [Brevundimonas sp.]